VGTYRHEGFRSGYVVIRVDDYDLPGIPKEKLIAVKELWWSEEKANAEVARLNALNRPKGARYFAYHCTSSRNPRREAGAREFRSATNSEMSAE
jgi:hypothetical protein